MFVCQDISICSSESYIEELQEQITLLAEEEGRLDAELKYSDFLREHFEERSKYFEGRVAELEAIEKGHQTEINALRLERDDLLEQIEYLEQEKGVREKRRNSI